MEVLAVAIATGDCPARGWGVFLGVCLLARLGRMVNRTSGDPALQLHERHDASDFDTQTQDKIGTAGAD